MGFKIFILIIDILGFCFYIEFTEIEKGKIMNSRDLGFYSDHPAQAASMRADSIKHNRARRQREEDNSSSTWAQEQCWANDELEERRVFKRDELAYELRNEEE